MRKPLGLFILVVMGASGCPADSELGDDAGSLPCQAVTCDGDPVCVRNFADVPACGSRLSTESCDHFDVLIQLTGVDTARLYYYEKVTGELAYIGQHINVDEFVCMSGHRVELEVTGCSQPAFLPDCDGT